MVIAKLYCMVSIYPATHLIVNLSPDQEILSVFSRNYSNCQDRHVCIRQILLGGYNSMQHGYGWYNVEIKSSNINDHCINDHHFFFWSAMEYLLQYPHADGSNPLSLKKRREKCKSQDAKSSPVRCTIYGTDDKLCLRYLVMILFPVAVAKTAPVQHLTCSASCSI